MFLNNNGKIRRRSLYEIVGRVRSHFLGGVVALAAATALHAMLSIALLPLATRHLGLAEFGAYGLLMSIVALVGATVDGGAALLVPAHYGSASASERAGLFATLTIFASAGAGAAGLLLIILWLWQHGTFSGQAISLAAIVLSAVLMPMRAIANISVTVFSVSGRASAIAIQMAIQSLVMFLSTVVALFGFASGGTSLFVGAVCGQFAALCVGAIVLARHHELRVPSGYWFRRAASSAPTTTASGLIDGMRCFGENAMLTSAIGLHAVGVLGHARLYHGLLLAFANAVGHNVRASSLDEARNPRSPFDATRRAWTPVQIAIACLGVVFAFVGQEIVDIVSNGKFTEAAAYIPPLFLIALLQTTEQPANAIICASTRAASATWTRTIMGLASFIILIPTIVFFGIKGMLVVCIVEAVAYRSYLRILASRERSVPFYDHIVVSGSSAIIAGMACMHWASPTLTIRLGLIMLGIGILLAIGRRSVSEIIFAGHQIMRGELKATASVSMTMTRISPSLRLSPIRSLDV
jgi:O-antigen/teichoic acid export membrane protein